ncbi:hypothetical protein D5085_02655 [Ectothiorhodospiraceae bacterium BW-2]|nr:hypothetical protein D5085_02655 [Ectothiorhodospiraceae bacterium BW-2]
MSKLILMALLLLFSAAVSSQSSDPMRPELAIPGLTTNPAPEENEGAEGATKAPIELVLHGIKRHSDRRVAIINGELVRAGDTLFDARIIAIQPNSVSLLRQQQVIELYLTPQSIKQP